MHLKRIPLKPRGRPRATFLNQIVKELTSKNIDSIDTAMNIAQNRQLYKGPSQKFACFFLNVSTFVWWWVD